MNSNLPYCGELVRVQDPDRFLLSMFMPAEHREALWALFAFNHEVAKTREVVSETQLGLIRLQWWREALGKIYEGEEVLENEILPALAGVIRTYDLPREHFETLIYAREFDLEDVLPGNLEGLLNYADFTHTPLCKLALQICGDNPDTEPVQPIAVSYALMGLLRAAVFHAQQKRCYLPEDLMGRHEVRGFYDLKPKGDYSAVIRSVADEIVIDVREDSKLLKYMQKMTRMHMAQLKGVKYDVFDPKWALPPAFKEIRLLF